MKWKYYKFTRTPNAYVQETRFDILRKKKTKWYLYTHEDHGWMSIDYGPLVQLLNNTAETITEEEAFTELL